MAVPLPESRIAGRLAVDVLFNGQGEFCFPIDESEIIPHGCFVVRIAVAELGYLKTGYAYIEPVNNRWQVRMRTEAQTAAGIDDAPREQGRYE